MTLPSPRGSGAEPSGRSTQSVGDEFSELLAPLLAGARARGVADAFELLGLAAVLLDRTGEVLYASRPAMRLMGRALRIVEDHLVASRGEDREVLEGLLARLTLMGAADHQSEVVVGAAPHSLRLRLLVASSGTADDGQLLRGVVLLDDVADRRAAPPAA